MHPESDINIHSRHSFPARVLIRLRALLADEGPRRRTKKLRGERGMTLIEIMVVMALIGVIGSVVAVSVFGALQEGEEDATAIRVNTQVPTALTRYYTRKREFPESLQVLVDKKFLEDPEQILDGWKQPLIYEPGGNGYKLCSSGKDKRAGSSDDICKVVE